MEPTPEPDDPWQARGQARSWPVPGTPAPGQRQSGEDGEPAADQPPDQPESPPDNLFAPGRVNSALTSDTEMVALGSRRPADALLGGVTRWNNQAGFPPETNGHRNGDTGPRHGGAPIMNAPRSPFAPPGEELPPSASPLFAPSPFAPQAHGSAPVSNPPTIEPPQGPPASPDQQPPAAVQSPLSSDRSSQSPLAPGQSPHAPGQSPLAPGQAPLAPGQSPLSPGQSGHTPGQAPLAPGQSALSADRFGQDRSGQSPLSPDRSGQSPLSVDHSGQAPLSPDRSGQAPLSPDRSGQSPLAPGQSALPADRSGQDRSGQDRSGQAPLDGRPASVQPVSGSAQVQVPIPMPGRAAAALQASASQAAAASAAQAAPSPAPARPVSAQPSSSLPTAPQQEVNRPVPHALTNDAATPTRLEPTGWATNPRAATGSAAVPVSPSGGRRSRDEEAQDDNRTPAPRRAASLDDDFEASNGRRAARATDEDETPLRPGDVTERSITFWEEAASEQFRAEWHEVKAQFVDDPVAALTRAHDLLTEAVNELTESMLAERDDLDPLRGTATPDTESMRMAMRGYREFLDRILAL